MLRIVQSCSAGGELVGWNAPEVEWLKSLKEKPDAFRVERLEKHMLKGKVEGEECTGEQFILGLLKTASNKLKVGCQIIILYYHKSVEYMKRRGVAPTPRTPPLPKINSRKIHNQPRWSSILLLRWSGL